MPHNQTNFATENTPQHSSQVIKEMEMMVLGAILDPKEPIDWLFVKLKVDTFSDAFHRRLYDIYLKFRTENRKISYPTIAQYIQIHTHSFTDLDPIKRLDEISTFGMYATDLAGYVENIIIYSLQNKLIDFSNRLQEVKLDPLEANNRLYEIEKELLEITSSAKHEEILSIKEVVRQLMIKVNQARLGLEPENGVFTGFHSFDNILTGFKNGDLVILAARPGVGKTTLAINIMVNIAIAFHNEMIAKQSGQNPPSNNSSETVNEPTANPTNEINDNQTETGSQNNEDEPQIYFDEASLPGGQLPTDQQSLAGDKQKAVLMFSLEMSHLQIGEKIISMMSNTRLDHTSVKYWKNSDFESFMKAHEEVQPLPIYIDDSPHLTLIDIQSKIKEFSNDKNLKLVIIDYLQLLKIKQNAIGFNRTQEVSEISRTLKVIAKQFNVPIIALAQLSRKIEERRGDSKKPILSDLRESGSIEQDADIVCFINPGDQSNEQADHSSAVVEIIIAKNRNGRVGNFNLLFKKDVSRFLDNYIPTKSSN